MSLRTGSASIRSWCNAGSSKVGGRIRFSRPRELCRCGRPAARNSCPTQEATFCVALAGRRFRARSALPRGRGQPDHRTATLGFRRPSSLPRGRGAHAKTQLHLLASRERAKHRARSSGMAAALAHLGDGCSPRNMAACRRANVSKLVGCHPKTSSMVAQTLDSLPLRRSAKSSSKPSAR